MFESKFIGRAISLLLVGSFTLGCGDSGTNPPLDENGGPNIGDLRVTVSTTGADIDADGYTITVGSESQPVGANGTVTFTGLPVGGRSVQLGDVAANCTVAGSNSRTVTITAGGTASETYAVACEAVVTVEGIVEMAMTSIEDALFAVTNGLDDVGDLDQFSFEEARTLFREALDAEPDNETAAFGLAMTTLFVLEDHEDLRAAADDWEAWLDTHDIDDLAGVAVFANAAPFFWKRASLPLDIAGTSIQEASQFGNLNQILLPSALAARDFPPSLEDHQVLIRDVIVPAVEEALEALDGVLSPGFEFEITERMQGELPGEADVLELDQTEVLALRATLEGALATADIALAYVLTPSIWGAEAMVQGLQPGTTFGTLAPSGGALMASAWSHLLEATDRLQEALDFFDAEADDQSNDIIKRGDDLSQADIQEARDALADIEAGLQGPRTITEDLGDGPVTLTVDASQLFLNPIMDLKAVSPSYEVYRAGDGFGAEPVYFRFSAVELGEWIFPNPSFNGVFPELTTSAEMVETLGVEELYWEIGNPVGGYYQLITIDGLDCEATFQANNYNGNGCPSGAGWINSADLDLYGSNGDQYASLYLQTGADTNSDGIADSFESRYYEGTYSATRVSESEISVEIDVSEFGSGASLSFTGTLIDRLGWTGFDGIRMRGGSSISFTLPGGAWVMEKQ